MDFYELTYKLKNKMFGRKWNLSVIQEEKCLILAAFISHKN